MEFPFIAIAPRYTLTEVVAPDWLLSIGQIEVFEIYADYLCYTELLEIELFLHLSVCKQIIVV